MISVNVGLGVGLSMVSEKLEHSERSREENVENVIIRCSPRSLSCTDIAGTDQDPVDEKRRTVNLTLYPFSSTV